MEGDVIDEAVYSRVGVETKIAHGIWQEVRYH